jgi:hypothetical protein
MQSELNDAACDPQKLHADSVNSKMRPQTLDGSANSNFQVIGMETVQKPHGPNVIILD